MGWIKWYLPHSSTGKGRQIFTNLSMTAHGHCVVVTYCWVTHYTKTIITEISTYHLTVSTDQNLVCVLGGRWGPLNLKYFSYAHVFEHLVFSCVARLWNFRSRNKLDEAGPGRGIEGYNPALHLSEALSAYCPMKMREAPDATMNSVMPSPPQQTIPP